MADFVHSRIPDGDVGQVGATTVVGTSGSNMNSKRLLGDTGAAGTGRGSWYRTNGLWKTFMLYNADRTGVINVGVSVRIEACMELASSPNDPDVDTFVVELAELGAGNLSHSVEYPWRYVRARVHSHAGEAIQVGLFEQGQGS